MKLIKELTDALKDEIDGVEYYARVALETKISHPQISAKLYEIANQEYGHIDTLHDLLAKLVKELLDKGETVPPEMMDLWDERHKKLIERKHSVKTFLIMYK